MEEPPVQELRRRYTQGQLDEHAIHADPMEQFAAWFKEACQTSLDEPNAMSLATVSEEGQPSPEQCFSRATDRRDLIFIPTWKARRSTDPLPSAGFLLFP